MTDSELERRKSVPIRNEGIVDLKDLTPKPGGLFDPLLTREQRWGHIDLPFPVVNPAYENTLKALLGLSAKEFEELIEKEEDSI
jgi:DNA-directed RNA polymerase beta' subunit